MTTNPQTEDRARVAAALREHGMVHLGDQVPADEYDCCAEAVLAAVSVPAPAPTDETTDWGALVRETGRLRLEAIDLHGQAAEIVARVAEFELRGTAEIYASIAELVRAMADEHPSNAAWVQDCQHIADRIAAAVSRSGRVADETQARCDCPSDDALEHTFGTKTCTCIPWTRQIGTARYCTPDDTVDQISGWQIGTDCPHHQPAVVSQPDGEA